MLKILNNLELQSIHGGTIELTNTIMFDKIDNTYYFTFKIPELSEDLIRIYGYDEFTLGGFSTQRIAGIFIAAIRNYDENPQKQFDIFKYVSSQSLTRANFVFVKDLIYEIENVMNLPIRGKRKGFK